jgi:hypothetical protein
MRLSPLLAGLTVLTALALAGPAGAIPPPPPPPVVTVASPTGSAFITGVPGPPFDAATLDAQPVITVREGERVTFAARRYYAFPELMTLRVYRDASGSEAAISVPLEPIGDGRWAWTAAGASGVAQVTEAYAASPTGQFAAYDRRYAARLVVIPLPRSTPAECARWTTAAAAAQRRARAAYRVAKTSPVAAIRRRAYRRVGGALASRDGYVKLLADGRCGR